MTIREYKPEDRKGVEQCIQEFHDGNRVYNPHYWEDSEIANPYFDYLVKKIGEGSGKIFVAELEGKIVGYVAVRIEIEDSPRVAIKKNGYVSNLAVSKEFRGRGIGSTLLKKAERFTLENDAKYIALDVEVGNPAVDLYHKHGYTERSMWMDKKLK